jgi:uncharacterized membrane protein YesL
MGYFLQKLNPSNPGKGVSKDAPPKPRIAQFFIIYFSKLRKLILLNMMYFLFSIPAVFLAQYLSYVAFRYFFSETYNLGDVQGWLSLSLFVLGIPVVVAGPAHAGFTYVLRRFSNREPVFLWSDFKEHSLKNFKQSMIISVINLVLFFVLSSSISWYITMGEKSLFMSILVGLQMLLLIMLFMMNLYIYPMMVAFELEIKHIYKNALIFSLIKFVPNLIIILLIALLSFGFMLNFIIGFVLLPIISLSTLGLIVNFYVFPILKKYMVDRVGEVQTKQK